MEYVEPTEDINNKKRKGQTLAEFALTLPLLLLLLFGTIEFARIFQAWVSLQNAARTAARYATTGRYDFNRYDLQTLIPCEPSLGRGNPYIYFPVPEDTSYQVQAFKDGPESLYATWYDGEECFPTADSEEKRKDILRIFSIIDEARRGAAGLAIENNVIENSPSGIRDHLFSLWDRPLKRSDDPGWFDVMMCSTRGMTNENSSRKHPETAGRFLTVLGTQDDPLGGFYTIPYCMMNEIQPPDANATDNSGKRWLDPGGPGDRVTIVVTFNHPLITPLGFAPYLQLQARRAAVNESFRASRAVGSIQGSSPIGQKQPTSTPFNTDTPQPTFTPSQTPSASPLAPTETNTPIEPFTCAKVYARNVSFFSNRFFMEIENENAQATQLNGVVLVWKKLPAYPNMFINIMALNSDVHWTGNDTTSPTNANVPIAEGTWRADANRNVNGLSTAIWEGAFNNGPASLILEMTPFDFGGSVFYVTNPNGGPDCQITLDLSNVPVPTEPDPLAPTPTATFTPDCASSQVSVRFDGFDTFGVVKLSVVNNRTVVAPFSGMDLRWIKRSPAMVLDKVTVGGTNPDDDFTVKVWQGPDTAPSTVAPGADGPWLTTYTFPPKSVTPLYLDFGGTSTTLSAAFGVAPSDFNGSSFTIGCGSQPGVGPGGTGGGGGGSGGGGSGMIFLNEQPTPAPTNTPAPSPTTGPSLTPSITRTPAPPTKTFTPAPPAPTKTPVPTQPPTQVPEPTDPGSDVSGGSG